MNLARDAHEIGADECPLADRCVVTAIAKDVATLSDASNSDVARLIALKFLGHFVGDVHQPMHVSFEDDRGGNSVDTTGTCGSNLHSAWDTCLLSRPSAPTLRQRRPADRRGRPANAWAWVQSSPVDWANESFAISIADLTDYCDLAGTTCDTSPVTFSSTPASLSEWSRSMPPTLR